MNKFDEVYMKVIAEQAGAGEEKTNYTIQVEYLKDHGFKSKPDDSGYGVDWIKQQGNFQIVINLLGTNYINRKNGDHAPTDCQIEAEVRYVKTISGAVLFSIGGAYHRDEVITSANEAVSKCAAFIGSLKSEIEGLEAW